MSKVRFGVLWGYRHIILSYATGSCLLFISSQRPDWVMSADFQMGLCNTSWDDINNWVSQAIRNPASTVIFTAIFTALHHVQGEQASLGYSAEKSSHWAGSALFRVLQCYGALKAEQWGCPESLRCPGVSSDGHSGSRVFILYTPHTVPPSNLAALRLKSPYI